MVEQRGGGGGGERGATYQDPARRVQASDAPR